MKYGDLPVELGTFEVKCKEMMFYQYLPIKMKGSDELVCERRLRYFDNLIFVIGRDFINEFGIERFTESYMYITAKFMFQMPNCSYNREGYHSDGFLTDDINYIWSDINPTTFNKTDFQLTLDDKISLVEMEQQAAWHNEVTYPNNTLLRLNQFNIHKVSECKEVGMRTFLKVSFSKDKYDLVGNSHNYDIPYKWNMKERQLDRNIPQSEIVKL